MSSEQVSDGRLDKELAVVKGGIDTNAERDEEAFVAFSGERVTDLYAMLTELKSLRAKLQAEPPAGCAEMAKAVRMAINEHLDKHPMNSEVSFAGCEDELIEEAVVAKLAPLFTLLAELREAP